MCAGALIQGKEVEDFANFSKESKTKRNARRKRYQEEEEEAVEHAKFLDKTSKAKSSPKRKAKGDDFDLVAALQNRAAQRRVQGEAFLNDLEARYCQPKKSKKSSK